MDGGWCGLFCLFILLLASTHMVMHRPSCHWLRRRVSSRGAADSHCATWERLRLCVQFKSFPESVNSIKARHLNSHKLILDWKIVNSVRDLWLRSKMKLKERKETQSHTRGSNRKERNWNWTTEKNCNPLLGLWFILIFLLSSVCARLIHDYV